MTNSCERFGDRVADYDAYRPGYPSEAVEWLVSQTGIDHGSVVADIGAGTGLFTRAILPFIGLACAVEPNAAMREAAETALGWQPNFRSVAGSSARTGLEAASVDLITAAQAFHWFDVPSTIAEFRRIARPGCWLALVWNTRRSDTPFLRAYEQALFDHIEEYRTARHRQPLADELRACFRGTMRQASFSHGRHHDLDGLLGGMRSASYCPRPENPAYGPLADAVSVAFRQMAMGGTVEFRYDTEIFLGPV